MTIAFWICSLCGLTGPQALFLAATMRQCEVNAAAWTEQHGGVYICARVFGDKLETTGIRFIKLPGMEVTCPLYPQQH